MVFEKLRSALKTATDRITSAIFVDKKLIESIIRDLQRALIEADVNIMLVKELSDKIRKTALSEKTGDIDKKEHIIKLLYDELLEILGEHQELKLQKKNKILLLGLYGSGKTTTIAKLGNYYSKRGHKVLLVGLDVHRPAAPEQLEQLAKKNNLDFFISKTEKDPLKIWDGCSTKIKDYDTILIDTAGRDSLDEELVNEIRKLKEVICPTKVILVIPADIGQAARNQTAEFKKMAEINGVIITRMDSSAKGGGALTACAEAKAPVYFITTGEKINDIEAFNPESFLSRLLGMGDLSALIEKIRSATGEEKLKKQQEKLKNHELSLEDVIEQVKTMNSIGGFQKIKELIPGLGSAKLPENAKEKLENQQEKIRKWEHIIKSMTKEEKKNPKLLEKETSRIARIARGAGVHTSDVRSLLKQYKMLQSFIKEGTKIDPGQGLDEKQLRKLAKKFGKRKLMI